MTWQWCFSARKLRIKFDQLHSWESLGRCSILFGRINQPLARPPGRTGLRLLPHWALPAIATPAAAAPPTITATTVAATTAATVTATAATTPLTTKTTTATPTGTSAPATKARERMVVVVLMLALALVPVGWGGRAVLVEAKSIQGQFSALALAKAHCKKPAKHHCNLDTLDVDINNLDHTNLLARWAQRRERPFNTRRFHPERN